MGFLDKFYPNILEVMEKSCRSYICFKIVSTKQEFELE